MIPPALQPKYAELHRQLDVMVSLMQLAQRGEIEWSDPRLVAMHQPVQELTSELQALLVIDIARRPEEPQP